MSGTNTTIGNGGTERHSHWPSSTSIGPTFTTTRVVVLDSFSLAQHLVAGVSVCVCQCVSVTVCISPCVRASYRTERHDIVLPFHHATTWIAKINNKNKESLFLPANWLELCSDDSVHQVVDFATWWSLLPFIETKQTKNERHYNISFNTWLGKSWRNLSSNVLWVISSRIVSFNQVVKHFLFSGLVKESMKIKGKRIY